MPGSRRAGNLASDPCIQAMHPRSQSRAMSIPWNCSRARSVRPPCSSETAANAIFSTTPKPLWALGKPAHPRFPTPSRWRRSSRCGSRDSTKLHSASARGAACGRAAKPSRAVRSPRPSSHGSGRIPDGASKAGPTASSSADRTAWPVSANCPPGLLRLGPWSKPSKRRGLTGAHHPDGGEGSAGKCAVLTGPTRVRPLDHAMDPLPHCDARAGLRIVRG